MKPVSVFALALLTLLIGVASFPALAFTPPDLTGFWQTEGGDGVVEFYRCENKYCGRFVWLKENSAAQPSLDDKNPDESLRDRPLCGMTFMGGFKRGEEAEPRFNHGWIYSPRHGAMFSAYLTLAEADKLVVHGYMLFPFLGQDQVWERTGHPLADCASPLDPGQKSGHH